VDAAGVPLAVRTSPANLHDSKMFETMLDAIPPISDGRRGHPRRRPEKVHADKGYDYPRCRRACAVRRIKHRIARIGIESKQHLGRHRWVVERTFARLTQYRRLSVRYERRADIHRALLTFGCALICWKRLSTL
jgi:transposase